MKKEKKETEIEEVHVSDDPLYVAIEEKRLLFAREYNKQKVINSVILGVTFLALILTYIFLMKYIIIALIVMIALIIFTIVYSSMKRKKVDKMTNDYIDYFYTTQTKFVFNNNVDFVDVVSHPFEKLQPEEFVNGGFVLNVTHLGSRNSIYGQVGGLYFKAADCVARVTTNKVTETAFLGKYYMIQLDKEVNGRKNESEMSLYEAIQSEDEYEDINETIDKVCAFIKNERHREYFKMYCQGYSIEEISKKYNTKYNGTKTILSRIRKRLREHEKEIRELI